MALMLRDRIGRPGVIAVLLVIGLVVGLGVGATRVLEFGVVLVVAVTGVVWMRVAGVRHASRAEAAAVLRSPGMQESIENSSWSGRASLVCAEPRAPGPADCPEPAQGLLAIRDSELLFWPGPAAARRGATKRSWPATALREIHIHRSHLPSGGSEMRSTDADGRCWFLMIDDSPDLPDALRAAGLPYRAEPRATER